LIQQNIYSVLAKGLFDKKEINVIWNKQIFLPAHELRDSIKSHWEKIKTPYIFNGQLARLDSFVKKGKALTLSLCPGDYATLQYSNSYTDQIFKKWGEESLSRVLGISAVLVTVDEKIALMKRSSNVGEFPNCFDVFGGHVDVPVDFSKPNIFSSMEQELKEEVGLDNKDYRLELLALIEANVNRKPELVFGAKSVLPFDLIKEKALKAQDKNEWDKVFVLDMTELELFMKKHVMQISPSAFGCIDVYRTMLRG
jgi:8-oxo-dGTP pyrophosphatase MutT (NUDIX family)